MENVTSLKSDKSLLKYIIGHLSNIKPEHAIGFVICFVFSRANLFGVIRPFASAFYVAAGFSGVSKVIAILSITLGNAIFSNFFETIRQLLAIILFEVLSHVVLSNSAKNDSTFARSVLMAFIIGITGLVRGAVQGFHLYDLVVSLLSVVMVFVFCLIMAPGTETFRGVDHSGVFDGKKLFSRTVLLGVVIISMESVMIWNCELGPIIAGLAVLIIARRKGSSAGALIGAIMGMVIAIYDMPGSLPVPGMFALAGALAGISVKTRTFTASLWTLAVIFFSGLSVLDGGLIVKYYEALVSGILFLFIPKTIADYISDELAGVAVKAETLSACNSDQAQEVADRIFVLGKGLSRVSRNIEETILDDEDDKSSVIQWIIEAVAEKACNRCSMCDRCWNTYFYKTYKLIEETLSDLKMDENGKPEIPDWFRTTCTKPEKFIEAMETAYSVYKADKVWRQRLRESRILLSKQANIISGSVISIARSLVDNEEGDHNIENRLIAVAGNRGIPVKAFRYHNKRKLKPYMDVLLDTKNKIDFKILDEVIQENVQNNFIRTGDLRRDFLGNTVLRYMKKPRYKTVTGVARTAKETSLVSGDNFTFFITSNGLHISAISDGTGSGKQADKYSRTTIQILENLLDDGIEIGMAIRLLNLYLNVRGENERLATIDLCSIDLSTGAASFYKYGASLSFVKNRYCTEEITMGNNDTGSARQLHYKPVTLAGGDFVIMISDGILEAFTVSGESAELHKYIEGLDTINAQLMAEGIIDEAKKRSQGKHDDMTVLVTKLW
ncbi:MAG: SpoIIE family protein phosphatase [Clostridiaceae bacterium]|nr:SpoIIE family protein phosphatase [Clostridiaceae bacterium]